MSLDLIDKDHLFKVVLLGDGFVGKTSLRRCLFGERVYLDENYAITVAADFSLYPITIEGEELGLQIWDLAGQPRFKNVISKYYWGTKGAILVYDVTNPESFTNGKEWIAECFDHTGEPVPVVVVANKVDLRGKAEGALQQEAGQELVKEIDREIGRKGYKCRYVETSAVTGQNVKKAFEHLARVMLDDLRR
ncbi:MAG: Rab family GTPase [Candidatus Odinarchaeota archaeon]